MTDEEIFKNHTQWMIDNYGNHFMELIKTLYVYKTFVFDKSYVSKEYPYNGYIGTREEAIHFYLKRFGVNVIAETEEMCVYGKFIKWNDDFVNKLEIALKIVTFNEKMNKLNKDFER